MASLNLTNPLQITVLSASNNLKPSDHVGMSFWLATDSMLAAAMFFLLQVLLVPKNWAAAMLVCSLVAGVSWHQYMFLREIWMTQGYVPLVFRYIEWILTLPLQFLVFYLILVAARKVNQKPVSIFFPMRLVAVSKFGMLIGYMGQSTNAEGERVIPKWVSFAGTQVCWLYLFFEVFIGQGAFLARQLSSEAAKVFLAKMEGAGSDAQERRMMDAAANVLQMADTDGTANAHAVAKSAINQAEFKKHHVQNAFEVLRVILVAQYLIQSGCFLATQNAKIGSTQEKQSNAALNFLDLVAKFAFGLTVYYAASFEAKQNEEEEFAREEKLKQMEAAAAQRNPQFGNATPTGMLRAALTNPAATDLDVAYDTNPALRASAFAGSKGDAAMNTSGMLLADSGRGGNYGAGPTSRLDSKMQNSMWMSR